jgi:hypothetical protein
MSQFYGVDNYSAEAFERILTRKDRSTYPESLKKILFDLSADKLKYGADIIGSYSYKSKNYGDIDTFEVYERPDMNQCIDDFANDIVLLANYINNSRDYIFGEVKMGIDHAYYMDLGDTRSDENINILESYYIEKRNLKWVPPKSCVQQITELSNNSMISNDDINALTRIFIKGVYNYDDREMVNNILRKYYILRWSIDELNNGYKILTKLNGETYNYGIQDALKDISNINIEAITTHNGAYMDISNFFLLSYNNGKYINLPIEASEDFVQFREKELRKAILKIIYTNIGQNVIKGIKRILSYGIAFNNIVMATTAYKLVNSDIAELYKIAGTFQTMIKAISSPKGNVRIFVNQLEQINFNLDNLIHIDKNILKYVHDAINAVLDILRTGRKYKNMGMGDILMGCKSKVLKYVNTQAFSKLTTSPLYPLSEKIIPKIL